MPAAFVGHGSPLTAFEDNPYVEAWKGLGERLPRPKAIVVVSGHWYTPGTHVTAQAQQKTIHDFYGFPEALYRFHYQAPGDPGLAKAVADLLEPTPVALSDRWGLDHGAWTVLMHMYPEADVPVIQLSMDRTKPPQWHYEAGQRLSPLRDEGVLVMGTGNIVHNLRLYDRTGQAPPNPMAEGFRKTVQGWLRDHDHAALVDWQSLGAQAQLAQPTPDHFLPLLYVAGLQGEDEAPAFLTEVTEGGGVDMTTVVFGG